MKLRRGLHLHLQRSVGFVLEHLVQSWSRKAEYKLHFYSLAALILAQKMLHLELAFKV